MLQLYQIAEGIVRLCDESDFGKSLTERYGLLREMQASEYVPFDGQTVSVGERTFYVSVQPDEKDDWTACVKRFESEFADQLLNKSPIAGDPSRITAALPHPSDSPRPFGIQIALQPNERLYGLGEASRTGINLRGRAFQNWIVYQQNEISIPVLFSNEGWGVYINCPFRHFVDCGRLTTDQLLLCGSEGGLDIFFFAADTMREALGKFCALTGMPMLLPKYAYGLTYIAPIHSDQFEVMLDARELRHEKIPCDMISLEPGWMTKFYDFSTEKQWALEKFHMPHFLAGRNDPRNFISALRRYGFHLSLWLCVDYDLTAEAERQLSGAETCVPEAWYKHVSKLVAAGVDGFKIDPCSLVDTRHLDDMCANGYTDMQMHNLQNTLLMKQMYEGFRAQTGFRPMQHYCGGYTGIQAYSACTTGDNGGRQGALTWILSLALSGHMNSTCDMDIHTKESIHFAMLVPWAHLNNWTGSDQPWWAGEENHQLFARYARLRYYLLPYLYSAAIEGHETGVPMLRPMPLQYPQDDRFADTTNQYMLGDNLMVTVYTDTVVFPEGEWIDYFTGECYNGGTSAKVEIPAERGGGLFVRAGAVIPCWAPRNHVYEKSDEEILLHIYPAQGKETYIFREDDGISFDFETKGSCHTTITCSTDKPGHVIVEIGAREGDYNGKGKRKWIVVPHGIQADWQIRCAEEDTVELRALSEMGNGWQ